MASLQIPEEYKVGLAKILYLDESSVQDLLSALADTPLVLSYKDISAKLKTKVKSLPEKDIDQIIEVLVSLSIVRYSADKTSAELIDDLCDAIDEDESEVLRIPPQQRDAFKKRLADFFNEKALRVASKARAVQREQNHFFCSARLLTDIRPVFESTPEEEMIVVPVHMLKITYHQREQLKEFFLALDKSDLKELRELIEKAEAETESLKSAFEVAKISYVQD